MMHEMQYNDILDLLYTKSNKQTMTWVESCYYLASDPFYDVLGQTHVNGWSRVITSQNGGSTSYIFPFRLRVLQWSRHLFNY